MLSIADIPLAGIHFTGIIGIVMWQDKVYRLATCKAMYRFRNRGQTVFAFETDKASFEYEYPSTR